DDHIVRQWLETRYPLVTEGYPQGIHLRAFRTTPQVTPPSGSQVEGEFGPLRLVAAQFPASTRAQERELHPPSEWLPVSLFWQASAGTTGVFRPVLQLADGRGVWGASLDRSGDLFGKLPPA